MRKIVISPGELRFSEHSIFFETGLGSCVAVTMHHRPSGFTGICHAMLPTGPEGDFRYVDASILRMVEWYQKRAIRPSLVEVFIFGGSNMFSQIPSENQLNHVGKQNSSMAVEMIGKYGFHLLGGEIGGNRGRKITFNSETGRTLIKRTLTLPELEGQFQDNR